MCHLEHQAGPGARSYFLEELKESRGDRAMQAPECMTKPMSEWENGGRDKKVKENNKTASRRINWATTSKPQRRHEW